ncbi:MAG: PilZ domain-containing protein, partial [Angelakisella sp.]
GMNYKGYTAIIISDTVDSEVRTTILEHDTNFMTISVRGRLPGIAFGEHVTILILMPSCVHEFSGVPRKSNGMSSSLTLYNGRLKESRSAVRYTVNSPAVVENLIFDDKLAPMCNPLNVRLINVSTSGALIRAKPNYFCKDAAAELKITVETVVQGVVVRVQEVDDETTDYGFRFI